mmetsp:Transcript_8314/g.21283  ORF Transcript_8314/g.21283 Transcript_8314/m.21283 type:complete len:155 (-) Transcript_8314:774-1238(-)
MDIQRADQLGAVAQELTQARRILLQRRVDAAYELLLEASKAPEDQRVLVKAYELGERIVENASDEPRDAWREIIVKEVARGPFFSQRAIIDASILELGYTVELLLAHLPALLNELGALVCQPATCSGENCVGWVTAVDPGPALNECHTMSILPS